MMKIEVLAGLILDGTQWMTRGNATDFGAEGREITRKGQSTSHLVEATKHMLKLKTGREEEFRALPARSTGRSDAPPLFGNPRGLKTIKSAGKVVPVIWTSPGSRSAPSACTSRPPW